MRRNAVLGILILAVGVIYLLAQMGVWHSAAIWLSGPVLWPLVMVAAGLFGLPSHRGRVSGTSLFMIVFGILLSLKDTGQFPWLNNINGWSLFLGVAVVLIGITFLLPKGKRFKWSGPVVTIQNGGKGKRYRGRRSYRDSAQEATAQEGDWGPTDANVIDVDIADESGTGAENGAASDRRHAKSERTRRLLGELHIGHSPWVLRDLDLWNGMGDIRVNLATAHVEDGTYTIDISEWMGDIRILVPEDLAVFVEASVSLGDLNVLGESHSGAGCSATVEDPNWATARQRCHIRADLTIGDIKVVRV